MVPLTYDQQRERGTCDLPYSGSTAAINKLVDVLNLRDEAVRSRSVVFISIVEHHSNILPWQNTGVKVNSFRKIAFVDSSSVL